MRRVLAGARLAVGFLTVLPVRPPFEPGGIGAAVAWFPAVGAAVGAAAGAVRLAFDETLGGAVSAVLAVVALVALTGALHQDGLADCADALGVRGGREMRLAVMREATIGAFGAIALILWALLLATALGALPRGDALRTLIVAGALGRWAAVVHGAALPPARREGLGAAFGVGAGALAVAKATALIASLVTDPLSGLAALAATALVTLGLSAWARRALGGRTGDTLGATVALVEVAVCLVLLGFARN
jgi:adenosylcobinamide-GDP ribazoletransferase